MSERSLRERVAAVMGELDVLHGEVADLSPFLGQWHAENGLRQAVTWASDCLRWLPKDEFR